ncbi:MAG: hypothetical protein QF713_00130 [Dehalococcoidales bacterium]|nr:hypothetical protein [Dehalococcoidales bacterium]MDP7524733.1 hypothetical protein [Dehalococcoidales bacterium]
MTSSRRWLFGFGLAIGVLAVTAVILVLTSTSSGNEPLLAEDTPEGVVQRFLQAVSDGDYLAAEDYLSPPVDEKTEYDFRRLREMRPGRGAGWKATFGDSLVDDDEATVEVVIDIFRPRGPFENSVTTSQVVFFFTKEADTWKITSPLNLWWIY